MYSLTRIRVASFALAILAAAAVVAFAALGGSTLREPDHYPEPPFAPVGEDFPRIIMLKEAPPSTDRAAYSAWQKERREAGKYLREGGVLTRATEKERKAVKAVYDDKYREARTLAEEVLRENPNSMPARFTLALAMFEAEENFPRALNLFRSLRRMCEERGRANPGDADAREWYIRTLDREIAVLSSMDKSEEELKAVACLEKVYHPLPWLKVWPLMKLKREAEARAAVEESITLGMPRRAMNGLAALESKLQRRQEALKQFTKLTEIDPDSAVAWNNLGKSFMELYRYDEAETALLRAARAARQNIAGATAYRPLAMLYIGQARYIEAADALKRAQVQRSQRDKHTLVQDEASIQRAISRLRLSLGLGEDALRTARRAFDFQDRTGSTSASQSDLFLTAGGLLHDAMHCRIQELRDVPDGLFETERRSLELDLWALKQKMTRLLDDERINEALKPGYEIEAYLDLLPPGTALAAVRMARETSPELRVEGDEAVLDAMEARCLHRMGRHTETLDKANAALAKLSSSEKLRRAELCAIAGDAAAQDGDVATAMTLWEATLRDLPVSFRMFDIRLPVAITDDGSDLGVAAAEVLRKSPRFRTRSGGYTIKVFVRDEAVRVELLGAGNSVLREATVAAEGDVEESGRKVAREFLARLHQPQVDMTQMNLGSLDGSLSAAADARIVDTILGSSSQPDRK